MYKIPILKVDKEFDLQIPPSGITHVTGTINSDFQIHHANYFALSLAEANWRFLSSTELAAG